MSPLLRAAALSAIAAAALAAAPAPAPAAVTARAAQAGRDYRPGEVVVRRAPHAPGPATTIVRVRGDVERAAKRLAKRPGVASAAPNWIARAAYVPSDPGHPDGQPGDWRSLQWNFLDEVGGVDAPRAWDNLLAVGRPGGLGVIVAVIDTGVAYRQEGSLARSPDMTQRLVKGYDFVDRDRYAVDRNGHGTHVASTIAEQVDNGIGLTGLAYGATIMPIRVLDERGEGDSADIARGIRFAARNGAKVINLSFEFSFQVRSRTIPDILSALRYAQRKGVLVVAAAGNSGLKELAYPARASGVFSVGSVTEHGCRARYSNASATLDLTAPGGGQDASLRKDPHCFPHEEPGRDIRQMTWTSDRLRRFGLPLGYEGTSMAAPHVSATAALVVASGVLGPDPTPAAIQQHLKATADDLGKRGQDPHYGAGKVNAGRATAPLPPPA